MARYLFIQLSELEQCRVKTLAQGFNTTAQDSNPGSLRRKSEGLALSHCAVPGVDNELMDKVSFAQYVT